VEGMREALELVGRGELDLGPLWTHSFPLSELGKAFEMMRERPGKFLKALVRM
jgi:NADPH:quinone reductase